MFSARNALRFLAGSLLLWQAPGLRADTVKPSLKVSIEAPSAPLEPWSKVSVVVSVKLDWNTPVLITEVSLVTDTGVEVARPQVSRLLPAEVTPEAIEIRGAFLVEQLGAEARAPAPPHWEWQGAGQAALVTVLQPQQSMRWEGSFRARPEAGASLRARVRYAVADPQVPLFQSAGMTLDMDPTDPGPSPRAGSRWVERKHQGFKFKPAARPLKTGAQSPVIRDQLWGGLEAGNEDITLYQYALAADAFGRLEMYEEDAQQPFSLASLAFGLEQARQRCGMATGPATRSVEANLWVLADQATTCLASEQKVAKVPGDAIALADALNDRGKVQVQVGRAREPDPGLVSRFRDAGFEVRTEPQKDGTQSVELEVPAALLGTFLETLASAGLAVDGNHIGPAPR
jgi:hypothetical protein